MLLGIATDKQIRKRLALIEERGFIQTKAPAKRGSAKEYRVLLPELQQALFGQMTAGEAETRSNDQRPFGHLTSGEKSLRSNNQPTIGQMTGDPSVKQPMPLRSNDRALKKTTKEYKKEDLEEKDLLTFDSSQETFEHSQAKSVKRHSPIKIGVVRYTQPPETIDLADLWTTNPGRAKSQLRSIAPEHKRLDMVAQGFGRWWVGPGLNDFDKFLIRACQNRKRKLEQPSGVGDAKTFINNMVRKGDWANLALRCDEAVELSAQKTAAPRQPIAASSGSTKSPFRRSEEEQKESTLGLARFKISRGLIE
ncbi:MAG: hypothetical protein AAF716_23010 [Cyanobacteria bacterium P01_D01_bin.1]